MLEVMLDSMVRIPGVQSVTAQLDPLRNHNARVRERRHARVLLTSYSDPGAIDRLSTELFAAYRVQRLDTAVEYVIGKMEERLIENKGVGFGHRGRREWIREFICSRNA